MTFIVGSVIIGAGAAIGGAMISSSGAKSAANTAAQGSQAEIDFARQSRDLVRADQAPYREAGVTALDALMSLTGLGGGTSSSNSPPPNSPPPNPNLGPENQAGYWNTGSASATPWHGAWSATDPVSSYDGSDGYNDNYYGRAGGGSIGGGVMYNVNELGPENVYDRGSYTRSSNPTTLPPSSTGYVGRDYGGNMDPRLIGWGGPQTLGGSSSGGKGPPLGNGGPIKNAPLANQGGGVFANSAGSVPQGPATPPGTPAPYGTPTENPGGVEGGYNYMTDPGYEFRVDEGIRARDRSAAARGGLLSGGYGRQLTRYGQDYASNEYTNVYNRISNIAGLGQVGSQTSANATMYAGGVMGNAASDGAMSSAYGQMAGTNAWANAANQIGQLPWGNVFGNQPGTDWSDPKWNPGG